MKITYDGRQNDSSHSDNYNMHSLKYWQLNKLRPKSIDLSYPKVLKYWDT